MIKKVRYYVNPWTVEFLCSAGEGFADFQKATALAKETAAYYGAGSFYCYAELRVMLCCRVAAHT